MAGVPHILERRQKGRRLEPEPVLVMVKPRKHRIHTYLYRRYETSGLRTEEQLQLFGSLLLLIAALFRFINSVLVLFFIGVAYSRP